MGGETNHIVCSEYSAFDNSRQGEYDQFEDEYVDNPTAGEYDNSINDTIDYSESDASGLAGVTETFCQSTVNSEHSKAGKSNGICQMDGNESLEEEDLESVSNHVDESEDEIGTEDPPSWHDPYTKEQEPRMQILRRVNTTIGWLLVQKCLQ